MVERSVVGPHEPEEFLECYSLLVLSIKKSPSPHLVSMKLHLWETETLNPMFSGCTGGDIHKMLFCP